MKKCLIAATLGCALFASTATADTIAGVYIGVQGWNMDTTGSFSDSSANNGNFNFDDETNGAAYIALEHPVPFLPNVKVNHTDMATAGTTRLNSNFTFDGNLYTTQSDVYTDADIVATDVIFYYELFDNDLISFDVGLNGKYVDGTLIVEDSDSNTRGEQDFSGVIPMVYSRVQVGLPFTGLAAYAEGSYLSFDDHTVSDYQVAIAYSFIESLAVDMTLQVGYRNAQVDIEDLDDVYADLEYDGVFAGLEMHF